MQFHAGDQVTIPDGTNGHVVEPYAERHADLFDLGRDKAVRVYWVLFDDGQVCRFTEDSLTLAA